MKELVQHLAKNESGVTAIEYGGLVVASMGIRDDQLFRKWGMRALSVASLLSLVTWALCFVIF